MKVLEDQVNRGNPSSQFLGLLFTYQFFCTLTKEEAEGGVLCFCDDVKTAEATTTTTSVHAHCSVCEGQSHARNNFPRAMPSFVACQSVTSYLLMEKKCAKINTYTCVSLHKTIYSCKASDKYFSGCT